MLSILTVQKLHWELKFVNGSQVEAQTKFSWKSVSEHISINIEQAGVINFSSECRGFQLIDWKKNKTNARDFNLTFKELQGQLSSRDLITAYNDLKNSK